jgi:hypothetical protein
MVGVTPSGRVDRRVLGRNASGPMGSGHSHHPAPRGSRRRAGARRPRRRAMCLCRDPGQVEPSQRRPPSSDACKSWSWRHDQHDQLTGISGGRLRQGIGGRMDRFKPDAPARTCDRGDRYELRPLEAGFRLRSRSVGDRRTRRAPRTGMGWRSRGGRGCILAWGQWWSCGQARRDGAGELV